jgi:hypothetical protein
MRLRCAVTTVSCINLLVSLHQIRPCLHTTPHITNWTQKDRQPYISISFGRHQPQSIAQVPYPNDLRNLNVSCYVPTADPITDACLFATAAGRIFGPGTCPTIRRYVSPAHRSGRMWIPASSMAIALNDRRCPPPFEYLASSDYRI